MDDEESAKNVAAIRAAWYLNKRGPTSAEEQEYRGKGFRTVDGFYAALSLLSDAVALVHSVHPSGWPSPRQRSEALSIVEAFMEAVRPVEQTPASSGENEEEDNIITTSKIDPNAIQSGKIVERLADNRYLLCTVGAGLVVEANGTEVARFERLPNRW